NTDEVPDALLLLAWNGLAKSAPKHMALAVVATCAVTDVMPPGNGTTGSGSLVPRPLTRSFAARGSPGAPACMRAATTPSALPAASRYFHIRPPEDDAQR